MSVYAALPQSAFQTDTDKNRAVLHRRPMYVMVVGSVLCTVIFLFVFFLEPYVGPQCNQIPYQLGNQVHFPLRVIQAYCNISFWYYEYIRYMVLMNALPTMISMLMCKFQSLVKHSAERLIAISHAILREDKRTWTSISDEKELANLGLKFHFMKAIRERCIGILQNEQIFSKKSIFVFAFFIGFCTLYLGSDFIYSNAREGVSSVFTCVIPNVTSHELSKFAGSKLRCSRSNSMLIDYMLMIVFVLSMLPLLVFGYDELRDIYSRKNEKWYGFSQIAFSILKCAMNIDKDNGCFLRFLCSTKFGKMIKDAEEQMGNPFRIEEDTSKCTILWDPPYAAVEKYHLKYQRSEDGREIQQHLQGQSLVSLDDLIPGTRYKAELSFTIQDTTSEPAKFTFCTVPAPTKNIQADADTDSVQLSWDEPEGKAGSYKVKVLQNNDNSLISETETTERSARITGLKELTHYRVEIVTNSNGKCSKPTSKVFNTVAPTTVSDVVYCTKQKYAEIMEFHGSTGVYPNLSNPRGRAVIFNNVEFLPESGLDHREGSNIDSQRLRDLFRAMHYDVTVHDNQTASEMLNLLRNERYNPDLVHHSSFILVILSHGADMDMICGVDGSLVKCSQITDMLNNQNCPNLFGKPKLIIIQACRGGDVDEGARGITCIHWENEVGNASRSAAEQPAPGNFTTDASYVETAHLPSHTDMIIAFSTTSKFVSYRNPLSGSWFIQDLVEVFRRHAHDKDVLTLLPKVNNDLASRTDNQTGTRKQCSVNINQLRKEFYLWPGLYSNDGGRTLSEFHN